jgi:hypothetical protein
MERCTVTTLNINGHQVQVDDSFLSLSPDQQNATVDEIAKSLGAQSEAPGQLSPQVQQYIAKAKARVASGDMTGMPAANPTTGQPGNVPAFAPMDMGKTGTFMTAGAEGVPIIGGLLDKGALNASAGLGSLISGQNFSDVKDQMQTMRDESRAAHPYARMAGNMAGAAIATAPLAATGIGAKAFGVAPGMSLPARMGYSALTNGAISGADTAARGGDSRDIAGSTLIGAGIGGLCLPLRGRFVGASTAWRACSTQSRQQ